MHRLKVLDIMISNLVTLEEDDNLEIAEQLMRAGRIHHLPVVAHGKLVGILTHADLLRAQVSSLAGLPPSEDQALKRSIPAKAIMSKALVTVAPDTSALRAAQLLRRHKYGCLPVVEEGHLVGIVTEGDFVELVIRALRSEDRAVESSATVLSMISSA